MTEPKTTTADLAFDPETIKGVPAARLDLERMLVDIGAIVESDWYAEMEMRSLPNSRPYTQEEALKMVRALGNIYSISHCLTCKACQPKYVRSPETLPNDSSPRNQETPDVNPAH